MEPRLPWYATGVGYAAIAVAGALLVAFLNQLVAVWSGSEPDLIAFFQALIEAMFIVGVLYVVARSIERRRAAIESRAAMQRIVNGLLSIVPSLVAGWAEEGGTTVSSAEVDQLLQKNADEWRNLGRELSTAVDDDSGSDATDEDSKAVIAFLRLSDLRWRLVEYQMEGARKRRADATALVLSEVRSVAQGADGEFAAAASAVRDASVRLTSMIQHTDATIIERLAVERTTPLLMQEPTPGLRAVGRLSGAAVAFDPLYLLIAEAYLASSDHSDVSGARDSLDVVRRSVHALGREVRAAAAWADAIRALLELAGPGTTAGTER